MDRDRYWDSGRADKGWGLKIADGLGFRGGNFEHFKTFVGCSRNGTVGHCITSLNTDVARYS